MIVNVFYVPLIHHIVQNVNQIYHYMIINVTLKDVNKDIIKLIIQIKSWYVNYVQLLVLVVSQVINVLNVNLVNILYQEHVEQIALLVILLMKNKCNVNNVFQDAVNVQMKSNVLNVLMDFY